MIEYHDHYLLLNDDVFNILSDANLSLSELVERLDQDGLSVSSDPAHIPGNKSDMAIFFGSAAVIAAATPAIIEIIRTLGKIALTRKQVELTPIIDSDGNVLKDQDGMPLLKWQERLTLLESDKQSDRNSSASIKGFGVELEISKSDRVE